MSWPLTLPHTNTTTHSCLCLDSPPPPGRSTLLRSGMRCDQQAAISFGRTWTSCWPTKHVYLIVHNYEVHTSTYRRTYYMCIYVHICAYTYMHACTYAYIHVHICACMCIYAYVCACAYMCIYVHVLCICAIVHTCIHAYVHVHTCAYMCIYVHVFIICIICTCICAYINTYIYTYYVYMFTAITGPSMNMARDGGSVGHHNGPMNSADHQQHEPHTCACLCAHPHAGNHGFAYCSGSGSLSWSWYGSWYRSGFRSWILISLESMGGMQTNSKLCWLFWFGVRPRVWHYPIPHPLATSRPITYWSWSPWEVCKHIS